MRDIELNSVNIRPGVSVLSVLPHLNYKHWYALAEFVDNSIQSAQSQNKRLREAERDSFTLKVNIYFDNSMNRITIKDNAAGIAAKDYGRAFRPAEIPPDASGLSEFGMGMKSAACWFSPKWHVRSCALGEMEERIVFFDVDKIVHDSIEELNVLRTTASKDAHYTEIVLDDIRKFPKGKTLAKIREHLASIYRVYIRNGFLELYLDDEKLCYEDPAILVAPSYKNPEGGSIKWNKEFFIDLGDKKSASGSVAIREKGDTRLAGLSLFRRNRLILGSADDGYKPHEIFGSGNSYASQRLFGEIHLKGFQVSHTKDGFKWQDSEELFLQELKKILADDKLPILQQAREYRATGGAIYQRKNASIALKKTATDLTHSSINQIVAYSAAKSEVEKTADKLKTDYQENRNVDTESLSISFRDGSWLVNVHLSYENDGSNWLEIRNKPSIKDTEPRNIDVKISMTHPFMDKYAANDSESIDALIRIGASMALAEVLATEVGRTNLASVRDLFNQILRESFS